MTRLVVYRCPAHPRLYTLCIEYEHSGERVLGAKCCISQYREPLVEWPLTQEVVDALTEAVSSPEPPA